MQGIMNFQGILLNGVIARVAVSQRLTGFQSSGKPWVYNGTAYPWTVKKGDLFTIHSSKVGPDSRTRYFGSMKKPKWSKTRFFIIEGRDLTVDGLETMANGTFHLPTNPERFVQECQDKLAKERSTEHTVHNREKEAEHFLATDILLNDHLRNSRTVAPPVEMQDNKLVPEKYYVLPFSSSVNFGYPTMEMAKLAAELRWNNGDESQPVYVVKCVAAGKPAYTVKAHWE